MSGRSLRSPQSIALRDKVETARCIAVSSKLLQRGQYLHTITNCKFSSSGFEVLPFVTTKRLALSKLEFLKHKPDTSLLIDGVSLQVLFSVAELI
jgi:phospholipid-translocating ATPase